MALKAITVNTPAEQEGHIYSQDDASIYQSIFGSDRVFNIGSKFRATVINNNTVRVSDGVLCVGGHVARMLHADYQDMVIENGASGYNRNDIIYAKFLTSGDSDTLTLEVKKGVAAAGKVADPVLTQGNLYQGAVLREYPLWRVKVEGLGIVKVEQMFETVSSIPDLEAEAGALNTKLEGKQRILTGAATTIASANLAANRALVSNSAGKVSPSAVSTNELEYLRGVSSNIQTQFNNVISSVDSNVWKKTTFSNGLKMLTATTDYKNYSTTKEYGNLYFEVIDIALPTFFNSVIHMMQITPKATQGLVGVSIITNTPAKVGFFLSNAKAETVNVAFEILALGY